VIKIVYIKTQNSNFPYCCDLLHFAYYCDDTEVLISSCCSSTHFVKINKQMQQPHSWSWLLPPSSVPLKRCEVRENTLLVEMNLTSAREIVSGLLLS